MRKIAIISFVLIFWQTSIYSQNVGFKTWIGAGYEQKVKIKKFKFNVGISQQFRVSNIGYTPKVNALTEVGVSKSFNKFYKIGIDYRATYISKFESRVSLSNTFKARLDPVTLSFRFKYQVNIEKDKPFSQDFRLKTKVEYKANKDFRPYVFGEILYNKNYKFSNFNEYRVGLGLDADYKKNHIFDASLMFVQTFNEKNPSRNLVLCLEYQFNR